MEEEERGEVEGEGERLKIKRGEIRGTDGTAEW